MTDYFIGLMSGTSADGIDAALVKLESDHSIDLVCSHFEPLPTELKQTLTALFSPDADNQSKDAIDQLGELDTKLGYQFASACTALLTKASVTADQVRATGSHGQTVRHRPCGEAPFTLQIGNPHIIAEQTGIDVVADFRRRDMACGGQAAPLAPAFHRAFLASRQESRVILNIGGIANITWLPKDSTQVMGFDTGPGNGLMDAWIAQQKGLDFDKDGQWAASGVINQELVESWLTDSYFELPPPKSTGKEHFHLPWAHQTASLPLDQVSPEDVQASLLELSAISISKALSNHCPNADRVLVCGGGVHNRALMERLNTLCDCPVETTNMAGIEPDWVEAMAFAWLAKCFVDRKKLDLSPITGSKEAVLLGALFPGN